MKTVDPLPVQIASMDKDTVLRLLRLLLTGTLLQSGSDINLKVSMWIWALLARLPVRGELSSDEVGVVRELGKKAVMLGVGLKAGGDLKEGLNEVEKVFEADNEVETADDENATGYKDKNTERIENLPEMERQITQNSNNASLILDSTDNSMQSVTTAKPIAPDGDALGATSDSHELEAFKSRLLANLASNPLVGPTAIADFQPPEAEEPTNSTTEASALIAAQEPSDWNTRATIDMIITISGEVYGQRDLLEFREVWGE